MPLTAASSRGRHDDTLPADACTLNSHALDKLLALVKHEVASMPVASVPSCDGYEGGLKRGRAWLQGATDCLSMNRSSSW